MGKGDILYFNVYGSFRTSCLPDNPNASPPSDSANPRASSNEVTAGAKPTTFELSPSAPTASLDPPSNATPRVKYDIQVPFKFSISTGATAPTGGHSSPKPNWGASYSIPDYGGADQAGGLIILEPIGTDDEDQEVVIKFFNKALGSLKLKCSGVEAKLSSGPVTTTSTWGTVTGTDLAWTDDFWDVTNEAFTNGKIYSNYGYYVYQPTPDASFLQIDPTEVEKKSQPGWMNKWVLFKFDLEVYNAVRKCNGSGAYDNRRTYTDAYRICTIKDICVAYQIQSSTAATSRGTSTLT